MNSVAKNRIEHELNICVISYLCEHLYKMNIHAKQGSASGDAIGRGFTASLTVKRHNTDTHCGTLNSVCILTLWPSYNTHRKITFCCWWRQCTNAKSQLMRETRTWAMTSEIRHAGRVWLTWLINATLRYEGHIWALWLPPHEWTASR